MLPFWYRSPIPVLPQRVSWGVRWLGSAQVRNCGYVVVHSLPAVGVVPPPRAWIPFGYHFGDFYHFIDYLNGFLPKYSGWRGWCCNYFFKDYVSFYRLRGGGGGPIDPTGQWVAAGAKIWYDEG